MTAKKCNLNENQKLSTTTSISCCGSGSSSTIWAKIIWFKCPPGLMPG